MWTPQVSLLSLTGRGPVLQAKGGLPYFETSAKEDINVEAAFLQIARNALRHEKEEEAFMPDIVDMNTQAAPARKSACC